MKICFAISLLFCFMGAEVPCMGDVSSSEKEATKHVEQGIQFGLANKWQQAIRELELGIKQQPKNANFRYHLSFICMKYGDELTSQKKYADAALAYRKGLDNSLYNSKIWCYGLTKGNTITHCISDHPKI